VDAARAELGLAIKILYGASRQNIALARNKVVENADGATWRSSTRMSFLREWLLTLFKMQGTQVDGVLGPVLRHFDQPALQQGLRRGNFYVRRVNRRACGSNGWKRAPANVLLKRELVAGDRAVSAGVRAGRRSISSGERSERTQIHLVR